MLDGKISLYPDMKFKKDASDGNRYYVKKLVEIA